MEETPEVYEILAKYSILNKFGTSYTWDNLDNESFRNIQLMQICMSAEESYYKLQQKKASYVSK